MKKSVAQRIAETSYTVSGCDCVFTTRRANAMRYPQIYVHGRLESIARVVLRMAKGDAPEDKTDSCHSCDNPSCIKADHLFWGSRSDNMRDCSKKGRSNHKGRHNGSAKLSEDQVNVIRTSSKSLKALSAEYGVSGVTIWSIRTGRTWS